MTTVKKLWGVEQWVVNEPEYCFKVLTLQPGFACSLHYHKVKKETFIVQSGCCDLQISDGKTRMVLGDQATIGPGIYHRFSLGSWETEPCVIYEVSTFHSDDDVVRLEESKRL
jgi:mannose-6-phosphate isomerase-like protein (cupin superfamily)